MSKKSERLGEENINNQGLRMKIVEYRNANNIDIKFEDNYIARSKNYNNFKNGCIKNPNFINRKAKDIWDSMIDRCYNEKFRYNNITYKDCRVCKEWLDFKNFLHWFNDNYYGIPNETMCLDKDILVKNNKEYSPDKCVFVPKSINSLFTKSNRSRGKYPIGVSFDKYNNKYVAKCSCFNKVHNLGRYDTIEKAFEVYKNFKEDVIKKVANKYKKYIPENLYNVMMEWKIEIDD